MTQFETSTPVRASRGGNNIYTVLALVAVVVLLVGVAVVAWRNIELTGDKGGGANPFYLIPRTVGMIWLFLG